MAVKAISSGANLGAARSTHRARALCSVDCKGNRFDAFGHSSEISVAILENRYILILIEAKQA